MTEIASGTCCRLSDRRRAVTVTSSTLAVATLNDIIVADTIVAIDIFIKT